MNMHALVDGYDIDLSDNESITEDDTADTTLGDEGEGREDHLRYVGDLPKL